MANRIFQALLNEKIEIFKNSLSNTATEIYFNEDNKLIHSLEYGIYRENACKDFIKFIIPSKFSIDDGFLINTNDRVSTQCDIVIYDSNHTPLFESGKKQRFFPMETVIAIGEVKSTLSKQDFKNAINKLSKIKTLRTEIENPSVIYRRTDNQFKNYEHPSDQIFTFLICKKLDFNLKDLDFDNYYDKDLKYRDRHNIILSIDDGIFLYKHTVNEKLLTWHYPNSQGLDLKNRFVNPGDGGQNHFGIFSSHLFMATQDASIFYPEFSKYSQQTMGTIVDEE
ncbi:hypothetical protein EV196_103280 [Mariniflexile fucanivorans]|uniref:DUF6602 domain-containing protein n=1 Tax=Mariniflexile fucanivorans TaxID=264023 RepID=A0A4R1RKX7_9FLAO|nr:DUF6602 domain-containing protein [Mariniflexile fucanivorans]TCL66861.1 hypothetical protein EV196_103280 [Mariniflexile fucanivorans]